MENLDSKSQYSEILIKNGILEEIEKVEIFDPIDIAGEHFSSRCEYVTVQFKDGKKSNCHFFVKRPTDMDTVMQAIFVKVMVKEGVFLTQFVSDMKQFSSEKLGKDNEFFEDMFPKVYYTTKEVLILENIAKRGYSMLNKSLRQDMNQAKLVLKCLAKLHAVSNILIKNAGSKEAFLEKYPTIIDMTFLPEVEQIMSRMFEPSFAKLYKMIHDSGAEGGVETAAKLQKYKGNFVSTFQACIAGESIIDCVNHGDCWNNNMMFSEKRDHVILLDWQANRVASPSIDIAYYLFTSTRFEVLSQWRELLKFYYDELVATCFKIDNPITFTYKDLVKDFSRKADLGFLFGVYFIMGVEAMKGEDVDKHGFKENIFESTLDHYMETNKEKIKGFVSLMINMFDIFEDIKASA